MRSNLEDPTLLDDDDPIRISLQGKAKAGGSSKLVSDARRGEMAREGSTYDRTESMGDDNCRPPHGRSIQSLLHQTLTLIVKRRRRLVQK